MLRKHCDTTGTQVADRLTDCERTRRLRRVRARGRIAVGVGVGRGGVAHGLLGRGRWVGGIQGWGSRTRYDEGIKGQGTRLEGTRPPYFTFSSDDTGGDSERENCEFWLYQMEIWPSSLGKQKWGILQFCYALFLIPRNFVEIVLIITLLWLVIRYMEERAFHRDAFNNIHWG